MKKTFGTLAMLAMLLPALFTVEAAVGCATMPQSVQDVWTTYSDTEQQILTQNYCGGSSNVSTGPNVSTAGNTAIKTQLKNPIKYSTFSDFAAGVTKAAVQILLPFIVLAFIYSGFLFVKAQGNEAELEKAKTAITYSIIGAFILLGSWVLRRLLEQQYQPLQNRNIWTSSHS